VKAVINTAFRSFASRSLTAFPDPTYLIERRSRRWWTIGLSTD